MSRSRRKTPIVGMTTAVSDKRFKTAEHRRERRALNCLDLASDELPSPRLFGNPWASEKDGKRFIDTRCPKLMRK